MLASCPSPVQPVTLLKFLENLTSAFARQVESTPMPLEVAFA